MLILYSALFLSLVCLGQQQIATQIQDVAQTQSGYGYFRQVGLNNVELLKVSSSWLQNDEQKQLFLSVGDMDENGWVANYWFLEDVSYIVNAPGTSCIMYSDYGYDDEITAYNSSYLSFLGTHTLAEHDDAVVNVFVGVALDEVGPLNVFIYEDTTTDLFEGMVIVGSYGKFAFNEFWYGDNSTVDDPPASAFILPDICDTPIVSKYPYGGGSVIVTIAPPGGSSSHLQVNSCLYTILLAFLLLVKLVSSN